MSKLPTLQSFRQRIVRIFESLVEIAATSGAPLTHIQVSPAPIRNTPNTSSHTALRPQ